jgi:hypothetical protein
VRRGRSAGSAPSTVTWGRFSEGTALDQEHRDDAERYLRDALAHFRAAGFPDAEGVEQLLAASADGTGGQ